MKAGVIAAGEGARFRQAGFATPKPLIEVGGMSLIARTLGGLAAAGADDIALIVNDAGGAVLDHVARLALAVPVRTIRKSTPGSFASLAEVARLLGDGPFLISTVDTLAPAPELAGFAQAFGMSGTDALLAYTDFVDDESPLRIAVDDKGRVTAIGAAAASSSLVTAGLYGFGPRAVAELAAAERAGTERLRHFLGRLVEAGLDVRGHRLSMAVDVDRPHDLTVAERFLRQQEDARCA